MAKFKLKVSARLMRKKVKRQGPAQKKQCRFDSNPELADALDYKNVKMLQGFLTERGKILPARISGNSAFYQRKLSREVKRARIMALLPFCSVR
jgi:small subunit ribosomal protein S18